MSRISPVKVIEIPVGMVTVHLPEGTIPPIQVAVSVNEPDCAAVKLTTTEVAVVVVVIGLIVATTIKNDIMS